MTRGGAEGRSGLEGGDSASGALPFRKGAEEALPRALSRSLKHRLIGIVGAATLRIWGATLRIEWLGAQNLRAIEQLEGRVCYACWHGNLLSLAYTHRGCGATVLASRHGDGEIISQIVCRLGYGVVRGSTTRGGLRGLIQMAAQGRRGHPLGVTPDGPRGPRRILQAGVLHIAQRGRVPIVPLAVEAVRRRELQSWDRFMIPYPWTRVAIVTGAPIRLPDDLTPLELEREWGGVVSAAMDAVQAQAESWRAQRTGRA